MKSLFRSILYLVFTVLVMPIWALYRLHYLIVGNPRAFYDASQLMSLFPGVLGDYLRYGFYRLTLRRMGKDVRICFGATLADPEIEIGDRVFVGPFANLGLCVLGDDVLIGTGAHILSGFGQHGVDDLEKPMREQPGVFLKIRIGEDCWIGNQCLVGNHVGRKSIIGAAALVSREIPEFSVAVGNPATVLRDRRDSTSKTSDRRAK
jgi:acetyltransferase-like isoleucine patch superfamily enzyme